MGDTPERTAINVYVSTRANARRLAEILTANAKAAGHPVGKVSMTDAVDLAVSEAIAERGGGVA